MSASESDPAGWRGVVDSYGGFKVFGIAAVAIVVVAAILFRGPLGFGSASDELPLGEVVVLPETAHVPDGTLGPNPPLTPAGGPHYALPLRQGIYDQPVPDGNAIHSLEHGMVWVSYQPDLVSADDLQTLEEIATDFDVDVLLSPRLENSSAVIVVSWGRRLVLDEVNEDAVRAFVTTNRNNSPEPGLR